MPATRFHTGLLITVIVLGGSFITIELGSNAIAQRNAPSVSDDIPGDVLLESLYLADRLDAVANHPKACAAVCDQPTSIEENAAIIGMRCVRFADAVAARQAAGKPSPSLRDLSDPLLAMCQAATAADSADRAAWRSLASAHLPRVLPALERAGLRSH